MYNFIKFSCLIFSFVILQSSVFAQPNLISLKTDFIITSDVYSENTLKVFKTKFVNNDLYSLMLSTGQVRPGMLIKKNFMLYQRSDSVFYDKLEINKDKSYNEFVNTDSDFIATDAQIIKLTDGNFLAVKVGVTLRDIPNRPEWWNISGMKAEFGGAFGQRGALYFFKSDNSSYASNNWERIGIYDAVTELNGDYGFPRFIKYDTSSISIGDFIQKNSQETQINVIKKSFYIGGFDRFEIYQDPWTSRIYITMWGAGGIGESDLNNFLPSEQKKHRLHKASSIIIYSDDECKSWNTLDIFDEVYVPYVMTSLPSGRFCVFYSDGSKAWIRFTSLKTPHILGPPVEVTEEGEKTSMDYYSHLRKNNVPEVSISRISTPFNDKSILKPVNDKVRVSYPILNKFERQAFVIKTVEMTDIDPPDTYEGFITTIPYITVKKIKTIESVYNSKMSAVMGTFIDPDYYQMSISSNTSVFYWMESTYRKHSGDGKIYNTNEEKRFNARYCIFYDDDKSTNPDYLSKNGGKPREWNKYWDIKYDSIFVGDYMTGGFAWGPRSIIKSGGNIKTEDTLIYLCQWAEPDGIHGNIITVNPVKKEKKKNEVKNNQQTVDKTTYIEIYGGLTEQKQEFTSETQRYTTKSESRSAVSFGFNFGYSFSEWLAFETGFQTYTSGQNISVIDAGGTTYTNDNANPINITSIPFRYTPRISLSNDFHILPTLGLKFSFNSPDKTVNESLSSQNNSGNLILSVENVTGGSPMISFEAGLGIEWNMLNQFSLILKGNFNSLLSENIKSTYKDQTNINLGNILNKLESLNGLFGLRYYLPRF